MRFGIVTTLCTGLFAGAATYINLVEHPARMTCGTATALAEWRPSYKRATVMQASLLIAGVLSAVGAAFTESRKTGWLYGGLLLASIAPLTLIGMSPTNSQLFEPSSEQDLDRVQQLLSRWNRLHAVRSALSASAFLIFSLSLRPQKP